MRARRSSGRARTSRSGFTLIELLVALAIIATLLTLAAPRYFNSIDKAKEDVLRENLYLLRDAVDKFYMDKGRYPDKLEDLVTQRYLRRIPVDPVTDSAATWVIQPPANGIAGAVYDVHSGAPGKARDGSAFSTW
ncbi:type II secretion system protein [Chitinimonas koreensis]|uniref:type II secretion system protein n=1 Tax=Chitinimonas koreensis TaxID=356302 RepID=UPI0003FBF077|nr:prepilin-type N-terminal cleavage/methylation domain-containing protein [Chitinimonas koreensis]QNM94826.1 prepilin-type N-terminal cleavage/methylation domain-containing protein [Chitinimonas koreensis]